jgi:hypothetical protein
MAWLALTPSWLRWAALAAVACVAAYAWHHNAARDAIQAAVKADRATWQAQAKRDLDAANLHVLDVQTKAAIADLEDQVAETERAHVAKAGADHARAELDGLRRTISAMLSGTGSTSDGAEPIPLADAGPALSDALSECSARYTGVAAVADQAIIQVMALQSYITRVVGPVCVANPP